MTSILDYDYERDDPTDLDREEFIKERDIECPHCGEISLPARGGECSACLMETWFAESVDLATLEEPAECLDCGLHCEADALNRYSMDAYAGPDDYDLFCPRCESDNIRLHKPKEDR